MSEDSYPRSELATDDDGAPRRCPACEGDLSTAHGYSTVVGIVRGDYLAAWECPNCGHEWPRTEPLRPGSLRTFGIRVER